MTPERWQQIRRVYEEAVSLAASERQLFLAKSCAEDTELRQEVESLLRYEDRAGSMFLKQPAADLKRLAVAEALAPTRIGRRIGVYEIVEEIGHGGMGEVYRAARVDGQYEKQVALKLVRSGYDSGLIIDRFRHERQILASLDHPNIARLLDGGSTQEGIPYLVMELIEGLPIDEYCDVHDLGIPERLQLFTQVCSAVQYAHQRLVVHRDLKPSNILVTAEGVPKLLDFGIAKILDPSAEGETTLVRPMTLEYASPEQVRGESITTATDIYSLGVVLYRVLTGLSPYRVDARNPAELARAITESEPEKLSIAVLHRSGDAATSKSTRALKGDLDNIVLKALRKEPAHRYGSIEHFADDVRRHLQGLPVMATQGSWSYRSGKFIRRHKGGIAAVTTVAITVMAGVAATLREAHIARLHAAIASAQRSRAERRFSDVRRLANSLMFEIHDSIEGVPGTTTARKLIVQRSREYLDSLAQESTGDASLQRELASAYERLGNVQGDMDGSSLGDAEGAVQSLRKAIAIREAVVAGNPGKVEDLIALTRVYHESGRIQWHALGGTKEGLQNLQHAITTGESAVRLDPQNVRAIETLARAYEEIGDIQGGSGLRGGTADLRQALENHRKAIPLLQKVADAVPSDPEKRYLLSRVTIGVGDDNVRFGDAEQALKSYRQAEKLLRAVAEKENNTLYRRGYALCHTRMGDALLMMGRPLEALTHYQKERQILEPLAVADPHDMIVQSTLVTSEGDIGHAMIEAGQLEQGTVTLERALARTATYAKIVGDSYSKTLLASTTALLGEALERSGKIEEARVYYTQSLSLYTATAAADAVDEEDAINAVIMRNHLASSWQKLGNLMAAQQDYRNALSREEAMAAFGPDNVELLYATAETYAGIGDTLCVLAARSTNGRERSRAWSEARSWYSKSLSTWQRIPNPGPLSPNLFQVTSPQQVSRHLVECETSLAKLDMKSLPE